MNKKYAIFSIPLLGLFLICSVMAFDYSIRGNDIINKYGNNYSIDVSLWHSDGKPVTCYKPNWCSNGISSQGKGSIQISSLDKGFDYKVNLHLDEYHVNFIDGRAYVNSIAKGTYWFKGIIPQRIEMPITYIYDKNTNRVSIIVYGESIEVPVTIK